MKDEVEAHFKEHYNVDGIEYICPAFDIQDYFEVVSKQQEFQGKKYLIENFL